MDETGVTVNGYSFDWITTRNDGTRARAGSRGRTYGADDVVVVVVAVVALVSADGEEVDGAEVFASSVAADAGYVVMPGRSENTTYLLRSIAATHCANGCHVNRSGHNSSLGAYRALYFILRHVWT